MAKQIIERFIRYAKLHTESDPKSTTFPSSERQWDLIRLLERELKELGVADVTVDKYGYVMATLPALKPTDTPTIGFLAHVDTSPDTTGKGVSPQIIENYDGQEIVLNAQTKAKLSPKDFPQLENYLGETLLTTDGTTLLGADDKAGITAIMEAVAYWQENPDAERGAIKIAFTPDEEIGKGVDFFDVKRFGADYAYTVDGGTVGELEYENFNAASAEITIKGRVIHPGYAKDKMINALHLSHELDALLPSQERPEHTTGYEGFFHLMSLQGGVDRAAMSYIIRDHDTQKFEERKELLKKAVAQIQKRYPKSLITCTVKDSYFNMRSKIEPHKSLIENACTAIKNIGLTPIIKPIRGGTDGAKLSYMGLPCPNLFSGAQNIHGIHEFVSVESIEKATKAIIEIAKIFATGTKTE